MFYSDDVWQKQTRRRQMSREILEGAQFDLGHIFDSRSVRQNLLSERRVWSFFSIHGFSRARARAGSGSFAWPETARGPPAPLPPARFRSRRTSPWKRVSWGGGQSLRSLLTCADRKVGGWQLSKPNSAQRGGEARRVSWSLSTVRRPRLLNGGVSFSGRVSPLKARMKLCMLGVGAEGKVCSGRRDHGEINGSLRCDIHPLLSLSLQTGDV